MLTKKKDKIVKEKGKDCSATDYPFRNSGIVSNHVHMIYFYDTVHPDKG